MYRVLRVLTLVLTVLFLLALPGLMIAQGDTPTPEPAPTVEPTPAPVEEPTPLPGDEIPGEEVEGLLRDVLLVIRENSYIAKLATLALIVTQLLKFYVVDRLWRKGDGTPYVSSSMVHLSVQFILWGGFLIASHLGYGRQYLDVGQQVGAFLTSIADHLIPATVSVLAADQGYKLLHKAKVSGFRFEPGRKAA
jgi:hypothetical protein